MLDLFTPKHSKQVKSFSGRFLNGSVLLLFHLSDLSNGLFNHNQTWIGPLSISVPMIISLGNFKFPEVSRLVLEILFYLPYFFTHAPKKNRRAQIKSAFSLDLTLERERARVKTGFGSIIMDVFICFCLGTKKMIIQLWVIDQNEKYLFVVYASFKLREMYGQVEDKIIRPKSHSNSCKQTSHPLILSLLLV